MKIPDFYLINSWKFYLISTDHLKKIVKYYWTTLKNFEIATENLGSYFNFSNIWKISRINFSKSRRELHSWSDIKILTNRFEIAERVATIRESTCDIVDT